MFIATFPKLTFLNRLVLANALNKLTADSVPYGSVNRPADLLDPVKIIESFKRQLHIKSQTYSFQDIKPIAGEYEPGFAYMQQEYELFVHARYAQRYGAGNCGAMTRVAFKYAFLMGVGKLSLVHVNNLHEFLLLGDLTEPSSVAESVVVDPHAKEHYPLPFYRASSAYKVYANQASECSSFGLAQFYHFDPEPGHYSESFLKLHFTPDEIAQIPTLFKFRDELIQMSNANLKNEKDVISGCVQFTQHDPISELSTQKRLELLSTYADEGLKLVKSHDIHTTHFISDYITKLYPSISGPEWSNRLMQVDMHRIEAKQLHRPLVRSIFFTQSHLYFSGLKSLCQEMPQEIPQNNLTKEHHTLASIKPKN